MKQKFEKTLDLVIFILLFFFAHPTALANNLDAIPAVSQLKEIQNTDWEYQALQSLVFKYNCTLELPANNSSYPITRYEFAFGLNKCLEQVENITSKEDLIILQRLQQDFASELAQLSNRVDRIETPIDRLESNRFATTTKLNSQVLFFIADSFGQEEDNSQTSFGYRTRLDLNTSFYGEDVLQVRLESRNLGRLDDVTDTLLSRLSVDGSNDNQAEISELSYIFALSDRTEILVGTTGVGLNDLGEVLNPFSSSGSGAISRFARRDPGTLRGPGGAGIGIKQEFSDQIAASAGYLIDSEDAANPEAERGLFGSSASAIAQVVVEPVDELAFAVTYTHTYERTDDVNLMGSTGIEAANEPFGSNATTSNNLSLQFNWEISSSLEIGGWFGYTEAAQQRNGNANATILNGALTFAFPDLWAENNLGGIIIGVPPAIADHDDDDLITEQTPFHIEALYRIEVNEYIEITPGLFAIINPDSNDGDTVWVGAVRTQFSF